MSDTENTTNEAPAEAKIVMDLGAALNELDHADEAHWEKNGILSKPIYPSTAVLSQLTGREITREEVQNFAPDFVRDIGTDEEPEAPATLPEQGEDGNSAPEEGERATLEDDGPSPVDMMQAAIDAATPDFIRFHPSFAQVVQQYQAMLPSIREEVSRNKQRGRKFGG